MDPKTCFFCSEPIEPGTTKCPFCGEALGQRDLAKLRPRGWGSPDKPMAVAVIGWVCVVAGALGLFGIASSVFMFALMGNNPIFAQAWGPPGSTQQLTMFIATGLGGVAAVVNLVAGYGLLRLRLWGRTVAVGLSIYAVLAALIMPIFTLPPTLDQAKTTGTPVEFMIASAAVTLVIQLVIQGLIIFFLTRPHVGVALRKASGVPA